MDVQYNNKITNTEDKVSEEYISQIEQKYNFSFPKDIKNHYLTFNGGELQRYVFKDEDGDDYIVTQFIPIRYDKESGRNLEFALDNLRLDEIIPNWLIPFADDPGGNLFCFSIDEDEEGAIYYWDHEYEYGEDPEDHVIYLTGSLKEFIDAMVEDE